MSKEAIVTLFSLIMLTLGMVSFYPVDIMVFRSLKQQLEYSLDGVILITGNKTITENGVSRLQPMSGTGFFIAENLILTNAHVAFEVTDMKLYSRLKNVAYTLELIAADTTSDIALVKIKDSEWANFKVKTKYNILPIKNTDDLRQGEHVYAIGHPWGFSWSVSQGIISGLDRRVDARFSGPNPRYFIQTDTNIFSGNSGGPLLDEHGDVVGMNTQVYSDTGGSYGFALPGELLEKVIRDLQDENKIVLWPTLGISIEDTIEGYTKMTNMAPDGPGAKFGLKTGDLLLSVKSRVNSKDINTGADLLNVLAILMDKDEITLTVKRGEQILEIPVVLKGQPASYFSAAAPVIPEKAP